MHTHIHTHVYAHVCTDRKSQQQRLNASSYTCPHGHTYTYIHTHTNVHMNARKHAWNDGAAANARGAVTDAVKLCTSLSFDAIKPHFAPPMQGLHCTHFPKHQYPSTTYPLFPTYPRTVRGPRASAVLLFYTDQMNRVHSSEETPRSFTMAPCVVVERLERKQRCSKSRSKRARRNPSPRMIKVTVHEETKG